MGEKKLRAGRNRTLWLEETERKQLLQNCLRAETLPQGAIENAVILGDCFSVLPRLPRAFVDLLIVDPPYNLDKAFANGHFRKMKAEAYEAFTRGWLTACLPLLKQTASVYVCCDWQSSLIIGTVLSDYLLIQNRITWQREKGRGAKMNWKNSMEDIWFATVSKDYTFNVDAVKQRRKVLAPYRKNGEPKGWQQTGAGKFRDTCPSNFWDDISVPYWSMPENTDHPTQKPEKLLAKLILASSRPNDMVFDPFLGSGSTAVAAKKLARNYVGIEIEEDYCALAEKRLALAESNASIQGYCDNVFWERNTLAEQKHSPSQLF